MLRVVRAENPDQVLHMGDHDSDCDEIRRAFPTLPVRAVRGNCDLYSHEDTEALLVFQGRKILITHGQRYQVKMGTELLLAAAESAGADLVIFGHTHIPICTAESGILMINPGSVRFSRTYGVLTLSGGKINYAGKSV